MVPYELGIVLNGAGRFRAKEADLEQRKHNLENEINELQNLVAQREARAEKARRDLDAIRARKDASKE
jgi:hypothetical protein